MNLEKVVRTPFQRFASIEGLGGYLLLGATVIAIFWANSPWGDTYQAIWEYRIGLDSDTFSLSKPIMLWINDALMAVFFFVIGLEIKRELLIGELNSPRKAALPLFAAVGGMIVPIILYLTLNKNLEANSGWGVPMATDIAFSLAIINALGKRVPIALKVFLTAFAIVDDIGGVLVIALFYSEQIKYLLIILAIIPMVFLGILSYYKYYSKFLWISLGAIVWLLFLKAGIHPTIAGVMLAFTVPIRRIIKVETFQKKLSSFASKFDGESKKDSLILTEEQIELIDDLEDWTEKVQSPLQHLEHKLHYWVAYLIMPLFALANAGVDFNIETGIDWVIVLIISLSLFIGKSVGIPLLTFLGIKLKITELPKEINFAHVIGVGFIAGVGFTMSIFISNLAFTDNPLLTNSSKLGILLGSFISGLTGYLLLRMSSKKEKT